MRNLRPRLLQPTLEGQQNASRGDYHGYRRTRDPIRVVVEGIMFKAILAWSQGGTRNRPQDPSDLEASIGHLARTRPI